MHAPLGQQLGNICVGSRYWRCHRTARAIMLSGIAVPTECRGETSSLAALATGTVLALTSLLTASSLGQPSLPHTTHCISSPITSHFCASSQLTDLFCTQ